MRKDLKSKYRKSVTAQYQDNVANKDKYSTSSGANQKCFNPEVQGDTKILSLKDGDAYVIRFVPYEVDETHPMVMQGKLNKDDVAYMLGFDMHVFGQDNTTLMCPHGTYSKKCPICERASEAQDDGDDDTYKALRPRRRVLYNIVILKDYSKEKDAKRDPNEVFVLHESQYLFEKGMLDELKKGGDEDDEEGAPSEYNIYQFCVGVTDPEESLALKVMCEGKKLNKSFSFKVLTHKSWFDKVDEDAVLEKAVPLHKLMREFSYEELENMLSGTEVSSDEEDDDDDEEERKSLKKKSAAKKSSRKDDDEDDEDEDERPHKTIKKAKVEEDDDDDDEEEERPHKSSKQAKVDAVNDDDDDDDDAAPFDTEDEGDDEGDDQEEEKKTPKCPYKHRFGVDVNKFDDDCEVCDFYDECLEKKRADRRK